MRPSRLLALLPLAALAAAGLAGCAGEFAEDRAAVMLEQQAPPPGMQGIPLAQSSGAGEVTITLDPAQLSEWTNRGVGSPALLSVQFSCEGEQEAEVTVNGVDFGGGSCGASEENGASIVVTGGSPFELAEEHIVTVAAGEGAAIAVTVYAESE